MPPNDVTADVFFASHVQLTPAAGRLKVAITYVRADRAWLTLLAVLANEPDVARGTMFRLQLSFVSTTSGDPMEATVKNEFSDRHHAIIPRLAGHLSRAYLSHPRAFPRVIPHLVAALSGTELSGLFDLTRAKHQLPRMSPDLESTIYQHQ